ncbi:MAG: UDP-3-O-acylglucosamine N-acyltransferase [Syntrophorhabdaceae bacterium PtaU1.Bin034]|nr:MAG: UDP-3-O-acylglucosamine N-acyltransferase [Syntrophorhabdaceae bacterium PtaU1.Bin034]
MIKLKEIAARTGGSLVGDGEVEIQGIAGISEAQEGDITFVLNRSFAKYLQACPASAFIAGKDIEQALLQSRNAVIVENPALAYLQTAELFQPPTEAGAGISREASVSDEATISQEASIFPYVYIERDAIIEKGVIIYPFCYIGKGVTVGEHTIIHSNVSVYDRTIIGKRVIIHSGAVLGSDGFGYIWDGRRHRKIPQLGRLEIEDDVEIGANTCIDRASLDRTVIKKGTKIDNLVQVGHNVTIGENSILVSQVGIAGSTAIGNNVVLGGKVGVRDHVKIGNNVKAAGGTGITKDVKDNSVISGTPHMGHRDWLRLQNYLKKLPELFERMGKIEERLDPGVENDRDR